MFGVEENHKERTHAIRYATFRKKEHVPERKPENTSIARVFATPKAAAKLLELSSTAGSREGTSLPIVRECIVRKPRKSIPAVSSKEDTDLAKGQHEMEVRRQARPILREKTEGQDTTDFVDAEPIKMEDRKISMKGLHRFAKERLPKESILREIILMEKAELTPEQYLDRLEIWLRLFDHEN